MPIYVQPSLFPEYAFAVVKVRNSGHGDYFRAECEPCQWIGWACLDHAHAEADAYEHDAEHHA